MHQYPLWKSVTVLVALLLAVRLARPNLCGEAPALQMSRKDRAPFTGSMIPEFEQLLGREGIAYTDAFTDSDGRLSIRFDAVESQLAARDAIRQAYEGQFAIATTIA